MGVDGSVAFPNSVLVDPGAFEATMFVAFSKRWSILVDFVSILSLLGFVVGFVIPVPIVVDLSMPDVEVFDMTLSGVTFSVLDSVEIGE